MQGFNRRLSIVLSMKFQLCVEFLERYLSSVDLFMRAFTPFLLRSFLLVALLVTSAASYAEVYSWRDASGRLVFGDSPPDKVKVEKVKLRPLTIADGYKTEEEKQQSAAAKEEDDEAKSDEDVAYKDFKITSPSQEDAIRANSGNVSVAVGLSPALKKGHGITLYVDGKQYKDAASTSFQLTGLNRGSHTVFAILHDENDEVIMNTEPVKFHVLRSSAI